MCTDTNVTNPLTTQSRWAMGVSPILDIVVSFLSVRIIFIHFPLDHDHSRAPWSSRESLGIGWIFFEPDLFPIRLPRPNVHQVPIVSACLPNGFGSWSKNPQFFSGFHGYFSQVWKLPFFCTRNIGPQTGWPPPNSRPIWTLARSQWGPPCLMNLAIKKKTCSPTKWASNHRKLYPKTT